MLPVTCLSRTDVFKKKKEKAKERNEIEGREMKGLGVDSGAAVATTAQGEEVAQGGSLGPRCVRPWIPSSALCELGVEYINL